MAGVFEPTPAQINAIQAHGGAITVSAAAGSGKTRVLVQRVIRHLTEENVPADRLLILTFTNTAAAEMRTRISRAIDDLIAQEPDNDFYRRQQLLLGSADICTIDSYCSKVVKENFFRLGINRDFRIGSETELHELRRRLMSDLIEKYYKLPPEGEDRSDYDNFNMLSLLLTGAKLDSDLEEQLLDAYDKYSAHAFPELWINACIRQYDPESDINNCISARYLMKRLSVYVKKLRNVFDAACKYRGHEAGQYAALKKPMYEKALNAYDTYEYFLENLEELYEQEDLDIASAADIISEFSKVKLSVGKTDPDHNIAVKLLNSFAETVEKKMKEYAAFSSEEYINSNKKCYPVIMCLKKVLEEYDDAFFAAKSEKGILDFHDLERLMLRLLYEKNENGEYVKTEFAEDLSQHYYEIMVDEYQDTNDIQESIFKAVSRNESNLFVVGDVKQSIYRFRDAQPELFKKRCAASTIYDEKDPKFPALIVLDKNFRSRSGIIDSVNYFFGLLMSENSGEIEYDETQQLSTGASYPDKTDDTLDTEVHFIEYKKQDASEDADDETALDKDINAEAVYCAGLIKKMVESGTQVTENGTLRKAEYGDFCILLRAVKNKAHIYSEELEKAGIPACTDTNLDLLERYEVRAAVSYLKILNNPLSDIDFVAALMCPVFGFTPDDLAELKEQNGKRYYKKLRSKLRDDDALAKKCRAFLEMMDYFRTCAVTMSSDRLLMEFYEKTGFICAVGAMKFGSQRVRNLRRFVQFAAEYENGTSGGLTGFVRHIKYLEDSGSGIKVADSVPLNSVRIMTIHHSKGLEFPICILAGCGSAKTGDSSKINYHPVFGIGFRAMDTDRFIPYNTVQYSAIKAANSYEEKSEQMRVLYVAMTRAKEKLIIISAMSAGASEIYVTDENTGKETVISDKFRKYLNDRFEKCSIGENGRFDPYEVMSCRTYSDWVTMCLMVSDKLNVIRAQAGDESNEFSALQNAPEIAYRHIDSVEKPVSAEEEIVPEPASAELVEKIGIIFKNAENTDISTLIPSKVTASMLAHKGIAPEFVAEMKPSFAREGGISPTERGTATHAFLQYADFKSLFDEISETGDFEKERCRVIRKGLMTDEQTELITAKNIKAFVNSDLFRRVISAQKIYREYRFTVRISGDLTAVSDPIIAEKIKVPHENINSVLQGSIDLMFEEEDGLVIVDYKTDAGKTAQEFADIYGLQLQLYKDAAEKLFDKPVKECYIYSLRNGETIPV